MNSQKIIDAARGWLGTKWRHQGRSKIGIDCVGLVIKVAEELNYDVQMDRTDYIRRSTGIDFVNHFKKHLVEKRIIEVEAGDILVFRETAFPYHSAIVGQNTFGLTIIHAFAPRRKVVEEQYTDDWKRKVTHCFALPKEPTNG